MPYHRLEVRDEGEGKAFSNPHFEVGEEKERCFVRTNDIIIDPLTSSAHLHQHHHFTFTGCLSVFILAIKKGSMLHLETVVDVFVLMALKHFDSLHAFLHNVNVFF